MLSKVIAVLLIVFVSAVCARELSAATFDADVVQSDETWLVDFYSPMCGSCSEFSPAWDKLEKAMKSTMSFGKINVDIKENMKLAEKLGVLDEGLPNVRLFGQRGNTKGTSIPMGDEVKNQYKNILNGVKMELDGVSANANGVFVKQ